MTRTLPWLQGQSAATSRSAQSPAVRSNAPERAPKRRRLSTPHGSSDLDLNTTGVSTPTRKARFQHLRSARTPSTSPPAAPPAQDPLRPGYAADDIYVMVEDEFLSTAQLYTQHLHHAEYQRLKALAAARDASTISRPIDARTVMPTQTKKELGRKAQDERTSKGLKGLDEAPEEGREEDEDDPWSRDPLLAGLMESERRPAMILKGLGPARTNTRAAAGFTHGSQPSPKQSPSKLASSPMLEEPGMIKQSISQVRVRAAALTDEETDDDDDLDAPVRAKTHLPTATMTNAIKTASTRPTATSHETKAKMPEESVSVFKLFARAPAPKRSKTEEARTSPEKPTPARSSRPPTFDEDVPYRRKASAEASQHLARRRAKKEREERRQNIPGSELPTFLF